MAKMVSSNSPIFSALSKIFAFIELSALWVVFSIPLVTIGASTTALYYTANKNLRKKEGYVWTCFWDSFKKNFKQSTCIWLVFMAIAVILILDVIIMNTFAKNGIMIGNTYIIFIILLILEMTYAVWVMIYIARIQDKTKIVLKNAFGLFYAHFSATLIIVAVLLLGAFFIWILPVFMFGVPSYGAFLLSHKMEKVFAKYSNEENKDV